MEEEALAKRDARLCIELVESWRPRDGGEAAGETMGDMVVRRQEWRRRVTPRLRQTIECIRVVCR